jgi:hypothetical protein
MDDGSEPMTGDDKLPAGQGRSEVDAFLRRAAATPVRRESGRRGRLIFALDATQSREDTWDRACRLQGEMFTETASLGGLDLQLVFYRGFGECKATAWVSDGAELARLMSKVRCRAGETQLGRVLSHAEAEAGRGKVDALVFVGDAFEESIDRVCAQAGRLALRGVPVFLFHEGPDPLAARAFREIARLTRGAYCPFDSSSPGQLRDLLAAVAVYAAGGRPALEDLGRRRGAAVTALIGRMGG